jgi:non-heme chloroperoxidase
MQKAKPGRVGTASYDTLEIVSRLPASPSKHRIPLLFVHGAYTAAWCWEEHFLPWFAQHGWAAYAVSLTGHGRSRGRDRLSDLSLDQYVADLVETIATLPAQPILIGHSMGGMVVQKYLEKATAPAAVLMASVPPQGLASSALNLLFDSPQLLLELNEIMNDRALSTDSIRQMFFHQPIAIKKLQRYGDLSQPESLRAIWDMTLYNLPCIFSINKPPMLVLGARHDRLIPPIQVQMTADAYGTRPEIFPDLGHTMMLEHSWEKVATRINEWLIARGL